MKYKKVGKLVAWCFDCKQEITGSGSQLQPYNCKCGIWQYSGKTSEYELVIKDGLEKEKKNENN